MLFDKRQPFFNKHLKKDRRTSLLVCLSILLKRLSLTYYTVNQADILYTIHTILIGVHRF